MKNHDELAKFSDEALSVSEHILFRCAIRALMASHPNPTALRESWNQMVAMMWRDHTKNHAVVPSDQVSHLGEAMRIAQKTFESYLPG